MTTTETAARGKFEEAGYLVVVDERDPGVFRVFRPAPPSRLVGMYVVRSGIFTYAELGGRVFPFHYFTSYARQVRDLYDHVRKTPA